MIEFFNDIVLLGYLRQIIVSNFNIFFITIDEFLIFKYFVYSLRDFIAILTYKCLEFCFPKHVLRYWVPLQWWVMDGKQLPIFEREILYCRLYCFKLELTCITSKAIAMP